MKEEQYRDAQNIKHAIENIDGEIWHVEHYRKNQRDSSTILGVSADRFTPDVFQKICKLVLLDLNYRKEQNQIMFNEL